MSQIGITLPKCLKIQTFFFTDLREDADNTLTTARQDVTNTYEIARKDVDRELTTAKENADRELTYAYKKVDAVFKAASDPQKLVRIAFVYSASMYGPYGAAVANAIMDKLENPNISDKELFESFMVGLAAGYAVQNVKHVEALKDVHNIEAMTGNLTTKLLTAVVKNEEFTSEDLIPSLAQGYLQVDNGDSFVQNVLDLSINSTVGMSVDKVTHGQALRDEDLMQAMLEGAANGVVTEIVHASSVHEGAG